MESIAIKIFVSDPRDHVGKILNHGLRKKGYELIEHIGVEPSVVIHNHEKNEFNLGDDEDNNAFYKVNVEGTKALCEQIDQWEVKPKAFIYFSSVAVYGYHEGELINENYQLSGTSPYAQSKILAEDFLIEWAYKSKVCLCILRLPELLAGIYSPGYLGEMLQMIRSGKYIGIGKGNVKKSVLWVEDIVDLIPKIPEIEGIYNLTDGYHPSVRELEQAISASLHKSPPFRIPYLLAKPLALIGDSLKNMFPLNSKKLDKLNTTLTFDDRKARQTFGWKSSRVLERLSNKI